MLVSLKKKKKKAIHANSNFVYATDDTLEVRVPGRAPLCYLKIMHS